MQDLHESSIKPSANHDPLQAHRPGGDAVQQGRHGQPHCCVPQPPPDPTGNRGNERPPAAAAAGPRRSGRAVSQDIPERRSQKGTGRRQTNFDRRLGPSMALFRPTPRHQLHVCGMRLLSGPSALEHSSVLEHASGIGSSGGLGHPIEGLARRGANILTPLQESLRDFVHSVHVPCGRRSPPIVEATRLRLRRPVGPRLRRPAMQE
mmetsp:Transcript_84426/g.225566  ORF Transcript_84426/g.225566 Transcript_84426/m.225566 type:complete len:206 (+) Transcript_84426:203-820(+)